MTYVHRIQRVLLLLSTRNDTRFLTIFSVTVKFQLISITMYQIEIESQIKLSFINIIVNIFS